ncbi:hypothetical protein AKJ45_01665 [candidate division MSBL1 archaeon SCGC-AAA261F19]|uniref:ORC1/DEAH AAA+ ATPase domain-containing protein n=1 Tax=candidate division MSBL1 archaeon SCGC-AAA261F19 TaxID=1698275 RepID=A0A133VAF3_9EURY|nr:hypothetical protein AKJ45_01665 [candidate division MSBL1 archaeon SCGC-AAA261F19]
MTSLIEEKFVLKKFDRKKRSFLRRFNWNFMPFAQKDSLPDPRLLVPHQREEVSELIDLVKEGDLVSFVVSDIGMGKTALCRFLVETLPQEDNQKIASVFLHGPSVERREQMLRLILERLELRVEGGDLSSEFDHLYRWYEDYPDFLLVLVVDEFPEVSPDSLEIVRAITDLKGTVWILNGRENQLIEFIEENAPALLKRRRYTLELEPMDLEEVRELLIFRMAWARGGNYDERIIEPFLPETIEKIYKRSEGVPREALKLASNAVYNAIKEDSGKITPELVFEGRKKKKSFWSFLPFVGR